MMETLQRLLWGWHVLLLILATGIQFTLQTGFYQIRKIGFWFKTACSGKPASAGGVSQFQALSTALAGSIGTGNIVGVAAAITTGGSGALFWMWISALFGMMTIFGENALSAAFPQAKGALGYIEKVKRIGKPLAYVYAMGCFLASLSMGNLIQTNAAAAALAEFHIPRLVTAIILAATLFFVAYRGLRYAVKITEKLVPLMSILFIAASLCVLFLFRERLPESFSSIFKGAFSLRAGAGGVTGMLIAAKTGISRGIFTNEAGLGSSAFAYDEVLGRTPLQKGCMGIFQVFIDTIVMCTITGLCILCSRAPSDINGAELTFFAYSSALGVVGSKIVSLCTALFAFATTVAWCCYGREGLFYLSKNQGKLVFSILFSSAAFIGCLIPLDTAFQISDACNGLMAIPNILALLYFSQQISDVAKRRPSAAIAKRR